LSLLVALPKPTVISVGGYLSRSPDKFTAIAGVASIKLRQRDVNKEIAIFIDV
jgi:hypothetical protein